MKQFQGIDGAIAISPDVFCLMPSYSFASGTPYRGHIRFDHEGHKLFLMCLFVSDRASATTVGAALAQKQPAACARLVAVLDFAWDEAEAAVDGIVPPVLMEEGRWLLGVWDDVVDAWEVPANKRSVVMYETMSAALEGRRSNLASYLRAAAIAVAARLRLAKPPGLWYRLNSDSVQFGMINYWVTLPNALLLQAFQALTKR